MNMLLVKVSLNAGEDDSVSCVVYVDGAGSGVHESGSECLGANVGDGSGLMSTGEVDCVGGEVCSNEYVSMSHVVCLILVKIKVVKGMRRQMVHMPIMEKKTIVKLMKRKRILMVMIKMKMRIKWKRKVIIVLKKF